jgi:tetratricopeptide (TPR) repeat protein
MRVAPIWRLVLLSLALAPAVGAEPREKARAKDAAPRRDPKGITGISPFWEIVNKGDRAYVARDLDGALTAYREAITEQPYSGLGHYRLGQAQLAKGNLKEAEAAYAAALRYAGADHTLRAKILFVIADLEERQKAYAEAEQAWSKYEAFLKEQPKAKGHPESGAERKKRVTEYKQLASDSAAVKARIDKRLTEADDRARKSAK